MIQTDLPKLLLEWYDKHGRELPWRVKGGAHPNAYVILVSEFMLQQTGVKTVIPYFHRFMERFPTVKDLAEASEEEVYLYWQGLGYYSRARSLHATAKMIVNEFGGKFPQDKENVLKLKGIGEYTVASFLALAFNQPETVIDGNVIRVICRMYGLTEPVSEIMDTIREKARKLTDKHNPADYASAIMDLGAMVCTPKKPQCLLCPWREHCRSKDNPELESIPVRTKLPKKYREGKVYLIQNDKGEIFIRKRNEKGLLSGLYEFPWSDERELFAEYKPQNTELEVSHVFTHFKLTLKIHKVKSNAMDFDGQFAALSSLEKYAFSTLMKKVYEKAYRNKILDI
ncbi:MAG: A/G-specific adenine glycosylase [Alphaproteobacteria bacterium]